jgi:serine/threonine protein kinase
LDLQIGSRLRSHVYEATHPSFPHPIVVKFARFAWEISWLEVETAAYEWIDGHGISPEFLGHLTDHGRVIRFMISLVEGARHATPQDFEVCQKALGILHGLGIKHGDIKKHNFLVHDSGVTLIDFDGAVKNAAAEDLRDELESLEQHLSDTSGRGCRGTIDYVNTN